MFYVGLEPLIWKGTFADLRLNSSGFLEIEFGGVQEVVQLLDNKPLPFQVNPIQVTAWLFFSTLGILPEEM
jgi:hypothetical protein